MFFENGNELINNIFKWYELINNTLINCFMCSNYMTQLMDEFLFLILSLFRNLIKFSLKKNNDRLLYNKVAIKVWKSWNILYNNWQNFNINNDNIIFDTFICQCKGVKAEGCTKCIETRNHSINKMIPFITANKAKIREQIFENDVIMSKSIFPFQNRLISMCCDMPSMIQILVFCCDYIRDITDGNIFNSPLENKGLLSLAKTTKKLFEYCFYIGGKGYEVCDKILRLWGMFLNINNNGIYPFKVLISIECHIHVLDSLNFFNIQNGPVLFNILMEKTKEFKNGNKLDSDIRVLLKDLSQNKFCKILMNLHGQWNDESEEMSVNRICNIIEGLKHLIQINHQTLNTQLFGLLSHEDNNYTLFFYSICKLIKKWKSIYFEMEDIIHLLIILDLANNNNKWIRIMNKNNNNDKKNVITKVLTTFFHIINNYNDDMDEKTKARNLWTQLKDKMLSSNKYQSTKRM
eukprot:469456_1